MALINIHLHYDVAGIEKNLSKILSHLEFIINQQIKMANEINEYLDRVEAALTNIKQDIQDIKDGLPNDGGLSAAEVAQIKQRLSTVVKTAEDLDAENTRPEVPGEENPTA